MNNTITSLALLKITWDNTEERRDYIQNFVPFVVNLFNRKGYDRVKVGTISKDFQELYGLSIPYHPMVTILDRTRKAGFIQKHKNGSFIPVREKTQEIDFTDVTLQQERKYEYVIKEFIHFCVQMYGESVTHEEAEQVFIAFVKDHDLDLLFINENLRSLLPQADVTASQKYLMYKFVHEAYQSVPDVFEFILNYCVGHIFANALIYQSDAIELEQNNLANCKIYLDTGFLFNLTGINEEERKTAYTEFIDLLRQQQAKLFVFRHTYEEFRAIIENSMQWIDNKRYDPVRASRATTYFVDNNFSLSDVEQFIIEIDPKLRNYGITVVESPDPQAETIYQIDEQVLNNMIIDIYKDGNSEFDEFDKEYTIYRDVKSIAAVHKFRKGSHPVNIRDATHVFITTNSTLVLANKRFERQQYTNGYFYVPAAVTDVFLGTILWLTSPTNVSTLNEKRLIATCFAAFQPNRLLIKKLAEAADNLLKVGEISSEDVTLLKQSRVARNLLQDETLSDPNRFTDKTALDILKEIRSSIQQEERQSFEQERFQHKLVTGELENKVQHYSRNFEAVERQIKDYDSKILHTAYVTARIVTWIFYSISAFLILYITVMQFYPNMAPSDKTLKHIFLLLAIILAVTNVLLGFNVKDSGAILFKYLEKRIIAMLKPPPIV